MNKSKMLKIVAMLLLAGILLFAVGFAGLGFDVNKLTTDEPYEHKQYQSVGNITCLDIQDDNVSISLIASPDSKFHIDYAQNEQHIYQIEEKPDGTLSILKQTKRRWIDYLFNMSFTKQTLTVALPAGFDGDVKIENENGDVTANAVSAANLWLTSQNQTTSLTDVTLSGGMTVETGNSSVDLSRLSAVGAVHVGMANGRLAFSQVRANSVTVLASNAGLALDAVTSDGFVELATNNGRIKLDRLAFGSELRASSVNGSIKGTIVGKLGDFSFACDTFNGDCNLPTSIAGGEKQIALRTSNGDIDISFVE